MRLAGFRVLGFGVESFSRKVLAEFNKAQIHRHIEPMLTAALATGVTPFLDMILSSCLLYTSEDRRYRQLMLSGSGGCLQVHSITRCCPTAI